MYFCCENHNRLKREHKNLLCSAAACIMEQFWYCPYSTHGYIGFINESSDGRRTLIQIVNSIFVDRVSLDLKCQCVGIVSNFGIESSDGCSFIEKANDAISAFCALKKDYEDRVSYQAQRAREDTRKAKIKEYDDVIAEINKWKKVYQIMQEEVPAAFGDIISKIESVRSKRNLVSGLENGTRSSDESVRQLRALGFVA